MKNFEELLHFINEHEEDWKQCLLHAPFNLKSIKQCLYNENWYCLMYNLFDSILDNSFEGRIVRECRGTIIEKIKGQPAKIICAPYTKFFNYGEINAATIDWKSAIIREKIDGWLIKCIIVQGDNDEHNAIWFSNGAFLDNIEPGEVDVSIIVNGKQCNSINQVLYYALENSDHDLKVCNEDAVTTHLSWMNNVPIGTTMMFELTSAWTQICTVYDKEPKLWLHGVRLSDGNEITPENAKLKWELPFDIPQQFKYNFANAKDVQTFMQDWLGKEHEGVVVCDKNFNRIKIKCEDYLKIKYLSDYADSLSKPKNLWKSCITGDIDDILANNPSLQNDFIEMNNKIQQFKEFYMKVAISSKKLFVECNENRKDFAIKISSYDSYIKSIYFRHCNITSDIQDNEIFNKTLNILAFQKEGYKLFCNYIESFIKFIDK